MNISNKKIAIEIILHSNEIPDCPKIISKMQISGRPYSTNNNWFIHGNIFMYLEYWKFKAFPFENVPDPRFFYLSRSHGEALTRMIYAAKMRKGGGMLSGEVGRGL